MSKESQTTTLTAPACRAARALLGWSARDLIKAAAISPNTLSRLENGEQIGEEPARRIVAAFEANGVDILNGDRPGARMRGGG